MTTNEKNYFLQMLDRDVRSGHITGVIAVVSLKNGGVGAFVAGEDLPPSIPEGIGLSDFVNAGNLLLRKSTDNSKSS